MVSNDLRDEKNLYRYRHCFNRDNICTEDNYCFKCFAYMMQENYNVSGKNKWSIFMQGEMKVVKSTEVSKKLIDSNTNEITFKVIMEKSLVDDQQKAAFNKQSLSISTGSPGSASQAGSSSPDDQETAVYDQQSLRISTSSSWLVWPPLPPPPPPSPPLSVEDIPLPVGPPPESYVQDSSTEVQEMENKSSSLLGQDVLPNISIEQQDEDLIANQNKKKDFCLECNKKLSNPSSLKRHFMRFHTEQKVQQIFCSLCEKNFGGEGANERLTKHYNQDHQNQLRIPLDLKCRICLLGYGNIKLLQTHFTKNHSKKPFQCCYCRKEFSTKDQKTRHLKKSHSTKESSDLEDWAITF